eukprot:NODE_3324_length_998_cov_50.892518_g3057_i0.p1 GENE.NODE_3324_length_998_cov_50.892518_g3057_i0~~NODE_3324_length_998_cov_50.892518_g3057_i0.p1  ORF type:complete len:186 (-),score=48.16 NODE_3324_length_998_cov_50.892518_g3057_i0:182-739(-)
MYDDEGNYIGELEEESIPKKKKLSKAASAPAVFDPFDLTPDPESSTISPFFSTNERKAPVAETFGDREVSPGKVWNDDNWVNPRMNNDIPRDHNVVAACSYGAFDYEFDPQDAMPKLFEMAPVAQQAVQRDKAKQREKRELEKAKKIMARGGWNHREKRKRDIGQCSGDKDFVQEEKRILRQQFD